MTARRAFGIAVAVVLAGCRGGEATAADAPPEGAPPAQGGTAVPPADAPRVSAVVRAGLAPGRPVPYRVTFENRTRDVLIPISVDASDGIGGASWGRPVTGEVAYDEEADRFVETPANSVLPRARAGASRVLYRSVLFPGEALVQEFEVRYGHTGGVEERFRLLYHRLSPDEFERLCYVATGDALPRRYLPVGLLDDPSARQGALLSGFHLRSEEPPEVAFGEISLVLPALPAAIASRFEAAGFEPDRAMAADWAGGWLAGDGERSVLVTTAGTTRMLPGVPFDAVQVIDHAGADVSFCITGVKRDEIEPIFAGREIVPFKCLHVSVPRTDILPTLERIGDAGLAVRPVDFQLREALDVHRVAGSEGLVAATPKPKPTATPKPTRTPKPARTPNPVRTPLVVTPTPTPSATPTRTPRPDASPPAIATATPRPSPVVSPPSTPTPTPKPKPIVTATAAPTPTASPTPSGSGEGPGSGSGTEAGTENGGGGEE